MGFVSRPTAAVATAATTTAAAPSNDVFPQLPATQQLQPRQLLLAALSMTEARQPHRRPAAAPRSQRQCGNRGGPVLLSSKAPRKRHAVDRPRSPRGRRGVHATDPAAVAAACCTTASAARASGADSPYAAETAVAEVADASSELGCEHFGSCAGCSLQHQLGRPPILRRAEVFFSSHNISVTAIAGAAHGWRTTCRIPVRRTPDGCTALGLFARRSHRVVPIPNCRVHHPALNAALATLEAALTDPDAIAAYDEGAGDGELRYVQAAVHRPSRRVQLTLVINADLVDTRVEAFAGRLWRSGGEAMWHSIWLNLNPSRTNNIVSYADGAWRRLHGEASMLLERFPSGATVALAPYIFRQANLDGFDRVVAAVRRLVPPGSRIVEWYAGVGVLGLALAEEAEWVRCSDVNPMLSDPFAVGAALLPPAARARVSHAVGSASHRLIDAAGAAVAVVDPPRKGLDAALLDALCSADARSPCDSVETVVYVSCGFDGLRRDAETLLAAGWRVRDAKAEAHVLFMGADHIETVVAFDREAPLVLGAS